MGLCCEVNVRRQVLDTRYMDTWLPKVILKVHISSSNIRSPCRFLIVCRDTEISLLGTLSIEGLISAGAYSSASDAACSLNIRDMTPASCLACLPASAMAASQISLVVGSLPPNSASSFLTVSSAPPSFLAYAAI